MIRILLFIFFLSLAQADECIHYQGSIITGVLYRQTFAGPPNYESVQQGDLVETYFLLKLPKPTCVSGGKGGEVLEENYPLVKDIQLVLDGSSTYETLRPFLGKQVLCTGKLFSAISGHHHTNILLSKAFCH